MTMILCVLKIEAFELLVEYWKQGCVALSQVRHVSL